MKPCKQILMLDSHEKSGSLLPRLKFRRQLLLLSMTLLFLETGCAGFGGTSSDVHMAATDTSNIAATLSVESNRDDLQEASDYQDEDISMLQNDIQTDEMLFKVLTASGEMNPFIANLLLGDITLAQSAINSLQTIIYVN